MKKNKVNNQLTEKSTDMSNSNFVLAIIFIISVLVYFIDNPYTKLYGVIPLMALGVIIIILIYWFIKSLTEIIIYMGIAIKKG